MDLPLTLSTQALVLGMALVEQYIFDLSCVLTWVCVFWFGYFVLYIIYYVYCTVCTVCRLFCVLFILISVSFVYTAVTHWPEMWKVFTVGTSCRSLNQWVHLSKPGSSLYCVLRFLFLMQHIGSIMCMVCSGNPRSSCPCRGKRQRQGTPQH